MRCCARLPHIWTLGGIRHITGVLSLALQGREEANLGVTLLKESAGVSLAEMTAGQPGFKGMTVEIWEEERENQTFA